MTEDELIREIQLKNQLSELDGSPVPEYDPSDGMDTVEELKRYIRFLYASLQDKDKENSQMRKDMAYREAKNRYPDMDWHPCRQNLLNWEDKGAIMLNMLLPALKDMALEEGASMPYKADRIMEIANKYGIPVVEDAAEGFGSRYKGQTLGTFGKYGVLSFNGNKMITTSGGGALITASDDEWREIMMYATQYRESYPYYQHEKIGYNYRMSNICAGIGRGQMTVVNDHLAHHKHVQKMYEELLADVPGVHVHSQPDNGDYDSNYWLCTITIDEDVKVKGQEDAYKTIVTGAVGGAAGVIHAATSAHTDCEPNANVEAMRVALDQAQIEARPVWKPMHKQPCYKDAPAYVNGVSEAIFKVGMCLPAGPYVSDDDVRYIVDTIKENIIG